MRGTRWGRHPAGLDAPPPARIRAAGWAVSPVTGENYDAKKAKKAKKPPWRRAGGSATRHIGENQASQEGHPYVDSPSLAVGRVQHRVTG